MYQGHWERLAGIMRKLEIQHIDPGTLPQTSSVFNLFGFLGIAIVTVILVIGIKESANFNSAIVIIKVCVLIVFLVIGGNFVLHHLGEANANWHPFIPPNTGEYGNFGISGIATAAGVIFFAYIGFDAVSTAAQEAKNPARDMPIGILGSLAICTVLYILVAAVLTGLVKYTNLDVPDPIAIGIDATGVRWGSMLVKLGAICGLSSTMVVMLLGQSRVFFSMSKDGLLPEWASRVHFCRILRRHGRSPDADQRPRRDGVDRYAARVHHRLRGHLDSARPQDGGEARVRDAVGAVHADHGHPDFVLHDVQPAARNLDPPGCLAGDRPIDLLLLQPET
jgi:APA family basic amino acid/polyamine antiporter